MSFLLLLVVLVWLTTTGVTIRLFTRRGDVHPPDDPFHCDQCWQLYRDDGLVP